MKAWKIFLRQMEEKVGADAARQWLHPLKVANFDAGNLYLEAENTFQIDWFEQYVRPHAHLLVNNNHRQVKIHLTSKEISTKHKQWKEDKPPLEFHCLAPDLSQTLFSFVGNSFVVDFFQNLTPGAYNPIYLYGPSGGGRNKQL